MEIVVHDKSGGISHSFTLTRSAGISIVGGDLASELEAAAAGHNATVSKIAPSRKGRYLTEKLKLPLFDEDTLFVLRRKIALAMGVPFYRIFMWIRSGSEAPQFMYNIITNTVIEIPLTLDGLFGGDETTDRVFGAPIDYAMIKAEGRIRYDSTEFFRQIGTIEGEFTVHVVDFVEWYEPFAIEIINAIKQQRATWVRGFVNKFWPMITDDVLEMITLGREYDIETNIPLLYNNPQMLADQCALIKELHAGSITKSANRVYDEFTMSITHAIVTLANPQLRINLVSMFNSISTSNNIPLIHLINQSNDQVLQKTFPAADVYGITAFVKTPAEFKDGIVIGMWIDVGKMLSVMSGKQMIFLNILSDGQMSVYTNWREDYKITYESHIKIINHFVNPVIERINEHHDMYTSSLLYQFTPDRTRFKALSVSIYWKRIISDADFKEFRAYLKRFIGNGIFDLNRFSNLQKDSVHLDFVKGGSHRDPYLISYRVSRDAFNYYSWLWLPQVNRIWTNLYGGIPVRIIHRTTDIRFELHNITPSSLELFKRYMSAIIHKSVNDSGNMTKLKSTNNKLSKLNMTDPVLFKFVKIDQHGDKKIYPVTCQKPKQPIMFSAEEYASLSDNERKKLVKYWNFTYSEPAYYKCPSADYPHLGFQVDVHPNGFCLPCCQKLDPRTKPFYNSCMSHGDEEITKDSRPNRHIFLYHDSPLDAGRIGRIPPLSRYLGNDAIFIYGVPQYLRGFGNVGLLHSIVILLGIDIKTFVGKIMKVVKDVHVLQDLHEIFIKDNLAHIFYRTTAEFNQLWIDMASQIYDINVLQINLQNRSARSEIGYLKNNIIVIEKTGGIFEPVLEIDVKAYHIAMETKKIPIAASFGQRQFDIKILRSIIMPAIGASSIHYKMIPEKIVGRIRINDTELGHLYKIDSSKGLLHLPYDYIRNPLRTTSIDDLHNKGNLELMDMIPFDRLRFDWLVDLLTSMKIVVAYGIRSEGRVRIVVDTKNRLYYTDTTVAEFEARGWVCDEDWHYDVNYVYHQIYTKFDMQAFVDRAKKMNEFKQDMNSAAEVELYNQLIYRNFTYVFILAISEFRNTDLRAKIMERIRDKRSFVDLDLSPGDLQSLRVHIIVPNRRNIAKRNYDVVVRSLQLFKFEFDDAYLQWMRRQPMEDLIRMIRDMIIKYVRFDENGQRRKPMMYHSLQAYEKHPLVIVASERRYLEELANHFVNPLYRDYFSTQSFGELFDDDLKNIDYTKLVLRPGERLDLSFKSGVEGEIDE